MTGEQKKIAGKPGWKTTEFWLTLALTILGAVIAAGLLDEGSDLFKIAGVAMATLSHLAYSTGRAKVKAVTIDR